MLPRFCVDSQGCRSPLVVKLADSHQEKELKRLQQMQAQLLNGANMAGLGALSQQYLAVSSFCMQWMMLYSVKLNS